MDISAFFAELPQSCYGWGTLCCYPRNAEPYCAILDQVKAMTTPSVMHLLNLAVRHLGPDECYLEVGTWRGGTLIGALVGNGAQGVAIDNDMMVEHNGDTRSSRDVWQENVDTFGLTKRATYIDASVPDVWEVPGILAGRKAGVYLFDGEKSTTEAAIAGLNGVARHLASMALIVIDDSNQPQVREAVGRFVGHYAPAHLLLDIPTPGNCWPGFWDGVMVIGWVAS